MFTPEVASWLADAVLVVHGLFIAWVVLGGAAVWRWPALAWLHVPAAAWGVWIEWSGRICPLTPLEWRLREAAGQAGLGGGFIEHYLTAAIYPEGLTREVQFALGAFVLALNLVLYGFVLRRALGRRG
ncbi:MAG: DUF2784 domain-containing protein [Rubrivivax sp.]|nr:DUF2784 domain-containing protein [Rubrivivax sp.]